MTTTIKTTRSSSGGFVALMLVTAGVLALVGRALPVAGDALAFVLGLELLAWAWVRHDDGPLVAGGITTGIGAGIVLAAGPLLGAAPTTVGGAFLLAIGFGFGLVGLLSPWWLHRPQHWAWITALGFGLVGGGLLAGPNVLAGVMDWALPLGLMVGGVVATAAWWWSGRR